jgi:hypothetical protein
MRSISWQIKGLHPAAREVACETAPHSGISVGAWLNSSIISKIHQHVRPGAPNAPASPVGPLRNGDPIAHHADGRVGGQIDESKSALYRLQRNDSAAERLGSNARLIPTIAFDSTVASRSTVYITAPSPIEAVVHPDYLAAALKRPRPVECPDQATERSAAAVLIKEKIGRQQSASSGKLKEGTTSLIVGISFIALALAFSGLSLAFNFFGAANSHLSHPPISTSEDAPLGSERGSWAGVSSSPGDEAAAAPKVISRPVQDSLAAVPPALWDEPLAVPRASGAVDPPAPQDEALPAPVSTPSRSEAAESAPHGDALTTPTATPSGPANPTLPQGAASGFLHSTAHRTAQVADDRPTSSADSWRRPQRGTNLARITHHTGTVSHVRPAHTRRRSVLPERCQATAGATRLKLRCLPLRRVGARHPVPHGPEGMRPSAPQWNAAPFALSPDFGRRVP